MTETGPPWFRLDGRAALLVDNGNAALTLAIAEALQQAGASMPAILRGEDDLNSLISQIRQAAPFDIFVHVAPLDSGLAIHDTSSAMLDSSLALIETAFLSSQAAAQAMLDHQADQGAIIHVASPLARVGAAQRSTCTMAMHALRGLVAASALELGAKGIRVNLVEADLNDAHERALGAPASHADVAASIIYLASSASASIAGASLLLDAGWTAR